jgi:RNA polymerase sigma-70 factor, ECF subfamily
MSDVSRPSSAAASATADDAALVAAAQDGDATAMNQLLTRHYRRVNVLCRRMLHNGLDAEDACQEALLQITRRICTFEGRSSFGTWVYSVTRRVCLNEIAKVARHNTVPFDEEYDETVAEVRAERHDRRRTPARAVSADQYGRATQRLDIDAAMRRVSEAYHAVLVLWFFGDMSLADIATELDIPVNTVKTRLFKGKAQLGKLLEGT